MEQLEIKKQKEFIKKVKEININKKLKYYILTMGCSLNENDSEKICGMLEEMGYQKTENQNNADIIIFNTSSLFKIVSKIEICPVASRLLTDEACSKRFA